MTEERIQRIEDYKSRDGYNSEAGFQIVTDQQTITLAIDDQSSCCETWGYLLSEDDPSKFIGAALTGIAITDTNRMKREIGRFDYDPDASADRINLDDGEVMFIDIETDRGVLQFAAYNAHNGYYGHEARVSSSQLEHKAIL